MDSRNQFAGIFGLNPGSTVDYIKNIIANNADVFYGVPSIINTQGQRISPVILPYLVQVTASPAVGGAVTGYGTYGYGNNITVTATPRNSYRFGNWTEGLNVVSTSSAYTFAVTGERKLKANFSEIVSPFPTRGELTKRFVEMFNLVYYGDHKAILAQIVDVDENHEYAHYISTMIGLGYISCYPDMSFQPYSTVTRAEYAALVMNVLGYDYTKNYEIEIKDIKGHWAELPACAAVCYGYMVLDEKGNFYPNNNMTREMIILPQTEWKFWEPKHNVEPDKVWTIKFNKILDIETIKGKNILVTGQNGNIIPLFFYQRQQDIDKVIYIIPIENYCSGQTYTLWIKDLKAEDGSLLSKNVKMEFSVK